eukprot:TRINITY_DN14103_c0_g1_i1.p2 TRINITY_DN14103_c0_g1~~TRINITY_DN14103_c0_g1_i1.p2  ORF type:complete len:122 (-),score=4.31 TRINITY_DN14103_c0_g1_i1:6-371(-)
MQPRSLPQRNTCLSNCSSVTSSWAICTPDAPHPTTNTSPSLLSWFLLINWELCRQVKPTSEKKGETEGIKGVEYAPMHRHTLAVSNSMLSCVSWFVVETLGDYMSEYEDRGGDEDEIDYPV